MLEVAVSYTLYAIILAGFILIFSAGFVESAELYRAKNRVKLNIRTSKNRGEIRNGFRLSEYISDMLTVVKGGYAPEHIVKFYEISAGCCLLLGVLSFFLMTPKVSMPAAVIGLIAPFFFYRTRLQEIRNLSSREGSVLAGELLNNYRIHHSNIFEAIRSSAESISQEAPYSRRMLLALSYELNTVSSKEDVRRAVERFKFGIGTRWADMLATDIELAQTEGLNIGSALEDLISSIAKAKKAIEETKRQGSEGVRILKYLVPSIYLLTIFASTNFFGMSLGRFYHNQFRTDIGSTWFMLVCLSYIISLVLVNLINKSRMDI